MPRICAVLGASDLLTPCIHSIAFYGRTAWEGAPPAGSYVRSANPCGSVPPSPACRIRHGNHNPDIGGKSWPSLPRVFLLSSISTHTKSVSRDGRPWFVAPYIATALEYQDECSNLMKIDLVFTSHVQGQVSGQHRSVK